VLVAIRYDEKNRTKEHQFAVDDHGMTNILATSAGVGVSPTPPETRRKRIARRFPPVSGSQGPLSRPRLQFDDARAPTR
jgi:hypothetical protein